MAKRRGRHFRYLLLTFHTHYLINVTDHVCVASMIILLFISLIHER